MKGGDDLRQAGHRCQGKPSLACHAVEQLRLVEAAHVQHPFDRLPLAAEAKVAGLPEGYRHDLKIKLRRGAPVDAELVQAGLPPPLQASRSPETGI